MVRASDLTSGDQVAYLDTTDVRESALGSVAWMPFSAWKILSEDITRMDLARAGKLTLELPDPVTLERYIQIGKKVDTGEWRMFRQMTREECMAEDGW